jgi:dynamin family protein
VHASETVDPLLAALSRLSGLAGADDAPALAALRERLAEHRLRVLVAGEAKRGKSTLVNALLGRAVLPMGVTPLTAVPTTVRYGQHEGATVVFRDSRTESCPLAALAEFVTESGNPANRRGVASVTAMLDAPLLAAGAELVDTPGTGSVYAHNTAEAEAALETMDAAVFVLTADPPVSAGERELMGKVARLAVNMFVVLNKADYLAGDSGELAEAAGFTTGVVEETVGHPVRIYPLSARAALSGLGDSGFAAFAHDFTAYLVEGRAADVRRSAAGHGRRLAGALLDEVMLARRAAQMCSGDAAARVTAFSGRLAAVNTWGRDAADLAGLQSARMLAELNQAAERAARDCTARVARELEALLTGELRTAPSGEIERAGRARLAELAVEVAEAWRAGQAQRLEQGLARMNERLAQDLQAELAQMRNAAADLMGLTLTIPTSHERLIPDVGFFYLVAEQVGQTELLAGAVRRRLPGEVGRRRARAWLRGETDRLVPQQIGRARADLQYRLAEATRQLQGEMNRRCGQSTARLVAALHSAAAVSQASTEEAARRDSELSEREQAIEAVLALLDVALAAAGDDVPAQPAGTSRRSS